MNPHARGKEAALEEGIVITRELFERVRPHVQGIQVSAPFGRIPFALRVFDGIPGIDASVVQGGEEAGPGDEEGFAPPGAAGVRSNAAVAAWPRVSSRFGIDRIAAEWRFDH